jgi:hypothetical protein
VRIPSWLEADPALHSEAVYIEADRFFHQKILLAIGRRTIHGDPNIPEYPVETIAGMDHVRALADSLGHYCKELRDASGKIDDIGDEPTSDFFNQLIVDAEEQLYFLESHLEAGDVQWL